MKENAILVSEYDTIGAELYYCYNYLEKSHSLISKKNRIKYTIENLQKDKEKYLETWKQSIIKRTDFLQFSEFKECLKELAAKKKEELIEICNKEIDQRKKSPRYITIRAILGFILFWLPIFGWVAWACIFSPDDYIPSKTVEDIKDRFWFLYGDTFKSYQSYCNMVYQFFPKPDKVGTSQIKSFKNYIIKRDPFFRSINNIERIKRELGDQKLIEIYLIHNPNCLEDKKRTVKQLEKSIEDSELGIIIINNSMKELTAEFKKNMEKRNAIIPSIYHNEEDIAGLIDCYVKKRGDTWKELVNEYEHDKKFNQVLSSVNNLSNQVSVLTDSVVKCFNIVGMQLGIINQSILSLQNTTAINLDKISQIENQQEKRLCELASSTQNMNVKAKVIIESK